jgi:hypothetical protein
LFTFSIAAKSEQAKQLFFPNNGEQPLLMAFANQKNLRPDRPGKDTNQRDNFI